MQTIAMVGLDSLMGETQGSSDVRIGLIDGHVAAEHPDLAASLLRPVGMLPDACEVCGPACLHGTFIAGMLCAARGAGAPAICPGCELLTCPVHTDCATTAGAAPDDVARAVHRCIDAGAMILNISSALSDSWLSDQSTLRQALDRAARSGVIVVAAAGNLSTVGSTALTGHPWVIPVVGYEQNGAPMRESTLGRSIGNGGLGAPGRGITSLAAGGGSLTLDGSSFAAPFVTGAAALLWSVFPEVSAGRLRQALVAGPRRTSIVPPLLDVDRAYRTLERSTTHARQHV